MKTSILREFKRTDSRSADLYYKTQRKTRSSDGRSGLQQWRLDFALAGQLSIQMLEIAQTIAFVMPESSKRSKYLFYRMECARTLRLLYS